MRGAGFADSIFITNAVMWQIETRLHARGRHINMRRSIFLKENQTVRRKRDEGDESVHKEEAAIEVANNSSGERPSSTTETPSTCGLFIQKFK